MATAEAELLIDVDPTEAKAYATVSGEGDWPSMQDVVEALKARDLPFWVDEAAIGRMLEARSSGRRVAVAGAKDGEVVISVESGDKEAYMVLQPAYGGREMEKADVDVALARKSVRMGIDYDAIEKALSRRAYGTRVLVARYKSRSTGRTLS